MNGLWVTFLGKHKPHTRSAGIESPAWTSAESVSQPASADITLHRKLPTAFPFERQRQISNQARQVRHRLGGSSIPVAEV